MARLPGFAGSPIIELDCIGLSATCLTTTGGGSMVKGLVLHQIPSTGILSKDGGSNVVQGNYISTDVTGTVAMGNEVGQICWIMRAALERNDVVQRKR